MVEEYKGLSEKEKKILKILYEHRRSMSLMEIANKANMSRKKANEIVKELKKKKWILEED